MNNTNPIRTNGMNLPEPYVLYDSLAFIQDMMERSQIPFILLKDLARCLFEYKEFDLRADEIVIGTYAKNMVDSCVSTLESILSQDIGKFIKNDKGYYFKYNDIPCNIRVIRKHFKVLDEPDSRPFSYSVIYIPNPFNRYWNTKSFI